MAYERVKPTYIQYVPALIIVKVSVCWFVIVADDVRSFTY